MYDCELIRIMSQKVKFCQFMIPLGCKMVFVCVCLRQSTTGFKTDFLQVLKQEVAEWEVNFNLEYVVICHISFVSS